MENIQKSKVCTKCKIPKNIAEFNKRSALKDGYRTECKKCQEEYNGAYYKTDDGKKSHNIANSKYKKTDKGKEVNKRYSNTTKGRETAKRINKKYLKKNKDKINEKRKIYLRERRKLDPVFKLTEILRNVIKDCFKRNGYKKTTKTAQILGCSFEEFKAYIESLWQPWMSWENYGKYNGNFNFGWDFDHIIPLSYAPTEEGLIKLCHFSNIQPLCSHINRDIKKDNLSFTIDTLSYNLVA